MKKKLSPHIPKKVEEEICYRNAAEFVESWRVWFGWACLALTRCDAWHSQWTVNDGADGLHPLSFQEGTVVAFNNMDCHLAIAYL